ncbi:putative quinol monooxygenase [Nocardioides sp. NPDC058538]|uniref:putative quinol monooxygenase n=1 Tax=Nocardioides sp. NPDC058538 TaxID=3346542 RepID=UPI0036535E31
MIIIAGSLSCNAADRDAYLVATADVARAARKAPGCLDFVQAADPIDLGRINVYERWASDADVEAFRISGGDEDGPELPQLTGADVRKYRISAVESP